MLKVNRVSCVFAGILALAISAFADQPNSAQERRTNEKFNIMKRDQVDSTDLFEIPLGDSEVEDEEEINRLEGKEVFKLPSAG